MNPLITENLTITKQMWTEAGAYFMGYAMYKIDYDVSVDSVILP